MAAARRCVGKMTKGWGLLLAAGLVLTGLAGLPVRAADWTGRWAVSQDDCQDHALALQPGGLVSFALGDDPPRNGKYKIAKDEVTIDYEDGDEQVLPILESGSPDKLYLYDDSIESDWRLQRCR